MLSDSAPLPVPFTSLAPPGSPATHKPVTHTCTFRPPTGVKKVTALFYSILWPPTRDYCELLSFFGALQNFVSGTQPTGIWHFFFAGACAAAAARSVALATAVTNTATAAAAILRVFLARKGDVNGI